MSLLTGGLLGVLCVIGIGSRLGFADQIFLFSAWYNRLLMGLVIGLSAELGFMRKSGLRGALLGTVVSLAWFLSTGLADATGFVAGIAYGIIIDWAAERYQVK